MTNGHFYACLFVLFFECDRRFPSRNVHVSLAAAFPRVAAFNVATASIRRETLASKSSFYNRVEFPGPENLKQQTEKRIVFFLNI